MWSTAAIFGAPVIESMAAGVPVVYFGLFQLPVLIAPWAYQRSAHPDGELARRASEGHDLIRLAPRAEIERHQQVALLLFGFWQLVGRLLPAALHHR